MIVRGNGLSESCRDIFSGGNRLAVCVTGSFGGSLDCVTVRLVLGGVNSPIGSGLGDGSNASDVFCGAEGTFGGCLCFFRSFDDLPNGVDFGYECNHVGVGLGEFGISYRAVGCGCGTFGGLLCDGLGR